MTQADKLQDLLREIEACVEARKWSKGKSLYVAWKECKNADWMVYLILQMIGEKGWPKEIKINRKCRLEDCKCFCEMSPSDIRKKYKIPKRL